MWRSLNSPFNVSSFFPDYETLYFSDYYIFPWFSHKLINNKREDITSVSDELTYELIKKKSHSTWGILFDGISELVAEEYLNILLF